MRSANQRLSGKIDQPNNAHSGTTFKVSEGNDGPGLNLNYVDPVIKVAPNGYVSVSKDIIAKWEPYPGAARYQVQVYENENIHDYTGQDPVFSWSKKPTVMEPIINLTSHGTPFKVGYYYTLEIRAEDEAGDVISKTARRHSDKDFNVV